MGISETCALINAKVADKICSLFSERQSVKEGVNTTPGADFSCRQRFIFPLPVKVWSKKKVHCRNSGR
jgi:hypothetical protein